MFFWTDEGEYRNLEVATAIKPILKGNRLEGVFALYPDKNIKVSGITGSAVLLQVMRMSVTGAPADPKDVKTIEQTFKGLHEAQDLVQQTQPQFGPVEKPRRKKVYRNRDLAVRNMSIAAKARWARERAEKGTTVAEQG